MNISKAIRAEVFAKFGGKCAYCGCDLPTRWHVDHFEPIRREPDYTAAEPLKTWKPTRLDRHNLANFMPACPPCNIDKHSMTLEAWRNWLAVRLNAMAKTPGFKLLSAHGLVATTGAPIKFYFERVADGSAP